LNTVAERPAADRAPLRQVELTDTTPAEDAREMAIMRKLAS
jgi:hypothetical protein